MDKVKDISEYDSEQDAAFPSRPYRGIKPFRYADRNIFAAREWEKEQLLNLISLYRGSLVFGQSGIGKSSLINAGLVPKLVEYNYQAEIIRVSPNRNGTFIIYKISKNDAEEIYLPSLFDGTGNNGAQLNVSLEDFKTIIFSQLYDADNEIGTIAPDETKSPGGPVVEKPTPVLIFDQFEELITLFEETSNKTLAQSEVNLQERKDFQLQLIEFFRDCYYNKNLRVKFIFVFREDYLAKFSKLLRAIPDLRDHTLRLKAISQEDIYDIIKCPFSEDKATYSDPPFTEELMVLLTAKLKDYFGEENAILTDIQIVCQYLYELPEGQRMELFVKDGKEKLLPIKTIIQLFYEKLLEKLPEQSKPLAIDVLSLLVLNERTRNVYHRDAIIDDLQNDYSPDDIKSVLNELDTGTRIVRSEVRSGGIYYEINSESIIPYINDLKKVRENEELEKGLLKEKYENIRLQKQIDDGIAAAIKRKSRTNLRLILISIAVLLIGSFVMAIKFRNSKRDNAILTLMAARRATNPTLEYVIAKNTYEDNKYSRKLSDYIKTHDSISPNIISVLDFHQSIKGLFFEGNDQIKVVGEHSINFFNFTGFLLKQVLLDEVVWVDQETGCLITLKKLGDTVNTYELRDKDGDVLSSFVAPDPSLFAIAPDKKTFLVDENIHRVGKPKPEAALSMLQAKSPLFKNTVPLKAATYTKDSKFIIAGIYGAVVSVFDLKGIALKAANIPSGSIQKLMISNDPKKLFVLLNDSLRYIVIDSVPAINAKSNIDLPSLTSFLFSIPNQSGYYIGSIALAPDSKSLIIGKGRPEIWNYEGKKLATLRTQEEEIISTIYSADGNQIATWSSDGSIFIWKNRPAVELFTKKELAIFSPFDYRMCGLENFTAQELYKDTIGADHLFKAALGYHASLPLSNHNTDDEYYMNILKVSVNELSTMYRKLLEPVYANALTFNNRKLLYNNFVVFVDDSARALKSSISNDSDYIRQEAARVFWKQKALLVDTTDLREAMSFAKLYYTRAQQLGVAGPHEDFTTAATYCTSGITLLKPFEKKFPGNAELNSILADMTSLLSWYSLYLKDYKSAISTGKEALKYASGDTKIPWIKSGIALGYLLDGQPDSAKAIYKQYQSKVAREAFLTDIKKLTDAKILSSDKLALAIKAVLH